MLMPHYKCKMSSLRCFLLGTLLSTLLGCYKYVPTDLDAVPTGDRVRALLSVEAQQDLMQRIGTHYTILEGKLLDKNDDDLIVSLATGKVSGYYGSQSYYQRIDVARQGVVRLDVRKVDAFQTLGLMGLLAGGTAFIVYKGFVEGEPGGPEGGIPPGNDSVRRALLRVTVFRW